MMSRYLFLMLMLVVISACSDEKHPVDGDHVWKEQTDMIDEARDIEQLVNDAALQQRQQVERATQ